MLLDSLSDKVYVTVLLEKTIHLRFYNHIGVWFVVVFFLVFFCLNSIGACMWGCGVMLGTH